MRVLLLWLCLAGALPAAPSFLERSQWLGARFRGLEVQEAWAALPALEALDRSRLPPASLIDFYLTRALMMRSRLEFDLAHKNEEEALRCAQGTARFVEVSCAVGLAALRDPDLPLSAQRLAAAADWARTHKCSAFQLGELANAQGMWLRENGQLDAALVSLLSARVHFAGHPWRQAQVEVALSIVARRRGAEWDGAEMARILHRLDAPAERVHQIQLLRDILQVCPLAQRAALAAIVDRKDGTRRQLLASALVRVEFGQSGESLLQQWLQRSDLSDYERLVLKVGKAGALLRQADRVQALAHFGEAQPLADRLRPQPGDSLLGDFGADNLRFIRATLLRANGHLAEASGLLSGVQPDAPWMVRVTSLALGTSLALDNYHVQEAGRLFRESVKLCEQQPQVLLRSIGYLQVFLPFLDPGDEPGPTQLLLASLKDEPELLEHALTTCEDWYRLEEKQKNIRFQGYAQFIKGLVLASVGRGEDAVEAYRAARTLFQKDSRSNDVAGVLSAMGRELLAQGKTEEGLSSMREAARLPLPEYVDSVGLTENLAKRLSAAGQNEEALEQARAALSRREKSHSPLVYRSSTMLGRVFARLGRLEESDKAYLVSERALEGGQDELSQLDVWREHSAVLLRLHRPAEASAMLQRAREQAIRLDQLRTLAELIVRQMEQEPERAADVGLAGLQTIQELSLQRDAEARDFLLRGAAVRQLVDRTVQLWARQQQPLKVQQTLALWKNLQTASAHDPDDPELARNRVQLTDLHAQLQHARPEQRNVLQEQLLQVRQQLHLAIQRLRQRNPDFDALVTTRADDLLQLQQRLGPHDLAVQIYPGEDAIYFQVVTPSGLTLREARVPRNRIFALTRELRASLATPAGKPDFRELSALLIHPIEKDLPAQGSLWLLPTSELWYVPWDALQRSNGEPLLATLAIACLTPQDLGKIPAAGAPFQVGHALSVGASDLPHSAEEARAVAGIVGGELLLGEQATPDKVTQDCRDAAILHLATHSQVDPHDLSGSSLSLFGGVLRQRQILSLPLEPGSLVVLSSCQSGLGEERPGREVTSLAAAFQAAGASSVISTLWRVDDEAQSLLFPVFYRALVAGKDRCEALAEAKRSLRARYAHPYYWSAQLLLGSPR